MQERADFASSLVELLVVEEIQSKLVQILGCRSIFAASPETDALQPLSSTTSHSICICFLFFNLIVSSSCCLCTFYYMLDDGDLAHSLTLDEQYQRRHVRLSTNYPTPVKKLLQSKTKNAA